MKNKKHIVLLIMLMSTMVLQQSAAGDKPNFASFYFSDVQLADSQQTIIPIQNDGNLSRRSTALIYSCVLPGTGQTMLGHTYKGLGFTLTAFGSLLTAVISHNNFVARGEQLDALEFQYVYATNWVAADAIYASMRDAHNQLKSDRNRRDLFFAVAAVIWTVNILDVLYNTEDEGETLFSLSNGENGANRTGIVSQHNPVVSISLRLP